jgi:hypothetical protein
MQKSELKKVVKCQCKSLLARDSDTMNIFSTENLPYVILVFAGTDGITKLTALVIPMV